VASVAGNGEESEMAEINAFEVTEVLGVQKTDDGRHMVVGFKTTTDQEVALALGADNVIDVVSDFLEATSIVPFKKGDFTALQGQAAFDVDWFQIGKIQDSDELALTLMRGEGHITFRLPSQMAPKILETLEVALGKGAFPTLPAGKAN
jgi:hypothetical protein